MAENNMHSIGSEPNTNSSLNRNPPDTHCFPPIMPPYPQEIELNIAGVSSPPEIRSQIPEFPRISVQSYGQVRFINAATYNIPVNIFIDGTQYAANTEFGTVSDYGWVADGFHTVTVRRADGPRTLLFEQTFPFAAQQMITLVLTDNASGGLDMVSVSDTSCRNLPYNVSCFRFANMSFSGSAFDLLLNTGRVIFSNVGFQAVSAYTQAVAGTYRFIVTDANTFPSPQILPVVIAGSLPPAATTAKPVITFEATLYAGQTYTAYVIGSPWSPAHPLQVIVVRDAISSALQPLVAIP